ncbi:MAG: methyltransferase domain-containing protein [Actinomycetota bacterium]|nr:methyltransferase domain-containing protein [Actinomycetota bacterium]
MSADAWQPAQYNRFATERRQPFDELVSLCHPVQGGVIYDLGCGTGALTAELADRLDARVVIGTDSSPAMLAEAAALATDRVRFEPGDLRSFSPSEAPDLILSNAALQWAGDHATVLADWRRQLPPEGQLAVQIPTNGDHPAYLLAAGLGHELADWFPDGPPGLAPDTVQVPEFYAQTLQDLGAREQHVALRVFTHLLDSTASVTEWIKGTSLNRFRVALGDERFAEFEAEYTRRLIAELGDRQPYLFTFKRILFWARF